MLFQMGQLLRKCAPRQSQQQNLKRQEQFMLLLVVLSPCYIGVSSAVPIFLRNGIDAQTACGIYACTGHGFPAAFLLTTFSLPSRISANGSFRNFVGVPLHNSHRRSGGRDVQPFSSLTTDDQRLVKTHCTPWGNLSSRAHLKGRRGTTTLPMWEDLRIEAVAHGSAMCLVMRAHTHRSRSRLGRPQSHRKALLRNLATQASLYGIHFCPRHGSLLVLIAVDVGLVPSLVLRVATGQQCICTLPYIACTSW